MATPRVALAMTTMYSGEVPRAGVALETIRVAREQGYEVVVVDGGTPGDFRQRMTDAGAVVLEECALTMGGGRRQALAAAGELVGETGIVIWTEEKPDAIAQIAGAVRMVQSGEADLVIPNRGDGPGFGLATCPATQAHAERYGNSMWHLYVGRLLGSTTPLDLWVGIRVMNQAALKHFLDYDGCYGDPGDLWDSIFVPVVTAARAGLRVGEYRLVSYNYEQPWETDDAPKAFKSLRQLNNLVGAAKRLAEELKLAV